MKAIALILVGIAATAHGFENTGTLFKELATPGTSDARRDALVIELSARTFFEVGTQAVQMACGSQQLFIYNPKTSKPWMEEQCPEKHKIWFAAEAIWHTVIDRAEAGSLSKPLAELSLAAGPENERMIYLDALLFRHYNGREKLPLERIARDHTQPPEIAVKAATILVQKEDANAYIRVLLEACDHIKESLRRTERFRFSTERLSGKLTDENKKLFLNYGFSQLSQIDDGTSGRGYFLAMHLGDFIGIKPIRTGRAFMPDQRLPQYQGEHGLNDSFFQDTVNNATKWWRENRKDYIEQG